ncbi:rhodanese-like domain-containing protein [Phaeobacter sp. QD34_3]|uniref:rhodanese-like domain-containing protein n=1 Tax=unclassified Phaeobacter TaxID=2621772 RepID=UPI00237F05EA|nr:MULTISPECIES: rhodanese-like domain-containing protein [unclassified Phaeobacter]MDE4134500.1 rhodanese-like domain-containing protein [Phaeobacter sp. QD34_3]MDE4138110.1 rhodanese-like domain-containing protein [Phaeobacter sp. QD34_24]MDE4176443.1 rhodanese-like domain-containing protein [Phaeobacter sp. PT47_59]
MPLTLQQMMEDANAVVERISVDQAQKLREEGALLLDIRDAPELSANGRVMGSHHIPRGMLEFRADPASPFHDGEMKMDRVILLHCASGGRAALASKLLKDMGYQAVYNTGGLADWAAAGAAIEEPVDRGM